VKERMIESHRLMPVSAAEAVMGYLIGPNAISISLFVASMVFGSIAAAATSVPVPRFLIASGIIVSFGTFLALLAVFASIRAANSAGIFLLFAIVPLFSNIPNLGQALPAGAIFCAPFIRKTVFSLQAGVDEPLAYAISELFRLLMGTLFFIGAMRRYRSPHEPGFTPLMGMGTVAIWLSASAIGIAHWDLFRWQALWGDRADQNLQWVVAVCIGIILAAIPVLLCDRLRFVWRLRRRLNPDWPQRAPMRSEIVIICCTVMIVLLGPLAMPARATPEKLLLIAAIVLLSLFTARYWGAVLRATSLGNLHFAFFAALWGGPPLVMLSLTALGLMPSNPAGILSDPICPISPPVALYDVWAAPKNPTTLGILVQFVVTITGATLAQGGEWRRRRKRK
jgi:hypothetical protein